MYTEPTYNRFLPFSTSITNSINVLYTEKGINLAIAPWKNDLQPENKIGKTPPTTA